MDHRPRKRFGQNFLHDSAAIQRILTAVAAQPDQHLVEIGPGHGAITAGLFAAAGLLDVVEIDRDLVAPLAERLGATPSAAVSDPSSDDAVTEHPRLRIHNADALTFDLCALVQQSSTISPSTSSRSDPTLAERDSRPTRLRLVGNLPYNISTPLLFRFLEQADCIEDMHLMLQKEVVDRIAAEPGSKVYGRLSVMIQSYCRTERLFVVAAGAFRPPPKVNSAVIRLEPLRPLPIPIIDPPWHARLVAASFSQRRKTLRNSLASLVTADLIAGLGIDPGARAEVLSVADFAALANGTRPCIGPEIP